MVLLEFKLCYWPVLTTIWFILTFSISYIIAVLKKHVNPVFPYISDTGTVPPESCIFGQMLNIGALFLFVTVYIRFRVVEKLLNGKCEILNKGSFVFGCLACFGISMVANFQETNLILGHLIGAALAFAIGGLYCMIQAYLSAISGVSKSLVVLRIITSGLIVPLYIVVVATTIVSFSHFDGKDALHWSEKYKDYNIHLVSSFSEWIMFLVMILNVLTIYSEFQLFEMSGDITVKEI